MASVDPHFSVYTYRLLEMGVDSSVLPTLSDSVLRDDCGIVNPVHRLKLLASLEGKKTVASGFGGGGVGEEPFMGGMFILWM